MNVQHSLKQQQNLILTAEMRQSLKLLAMPVMELESFLSEQLQENPLLEDDSFEDAEDKIEQLNLLDDNYSNGDVVYTVNRDNPLAADGKSDIYNSLYDYLLFQLNILPLTERDHALGIVILSHMDGDGRMTCSLQEIGTEIGLAPEEFSPMMNVIRDFDPPGVGSFDVKDCLILQLDEQSPHYDELVTLILEKFEAVAKDDVKGIAEFLKVDSSVAKELIETLKGLNPHPGSGWGKDSGIEFALPDATLKKEDGRWNVVLEEWDTPGILINSYYHNLLKTGGELDTEAKEYLRKKLTAATLIIKGIEQRRRTIADTLLVIAKYQDDFLDGDAKFPKPLTMRTVGDELNIHESTVSRAVADKNVLTPKGLFPVKYFFPKGVSSDSDESSLAIRHRIMELIENENPEKPLRDGKIGDILNEEGIKISRRTVAKYREQMQIPIAGKRKRF